MWAPVYENSSTLGFCSDGRDGKENVYAALEKPLYPSLNLKLFPTLPLFDTDETDEVLVLVVVVVVFVVLLDGCQPKPTNQGQ